MSEYQYYEFAAIDRPLSAEQMGRLRAGSSRARITPAGFFNHYEWGDLKADPGEWMRRYFDAFVYTANWGSCRLSLRLPRSAFEPEAVASFAGGEVLRAEANAAHWIFDWSLDGGSDEERFAADEGQGWMGRLSPLRDELLRGDWRALYLGWLASVARGQIDEAALVPEVPGLASLSVP